MFPTGKNSSGSLSRHAARLRQSMLISHSIPGKLVECFVKIFTKGNKGKGPNRAPLVISNKPVMLTLCKQGGLMTEVPLRRERCITLAGGALTSSRLCPVLCQCVKSP